MEVPELSDFYLGGGTNLALKYNHRESIDADLFSSSTVGAGRMASISKALHDMYGNAGLECALENSGSENLSFINAFVRKNNTDIKIQIIQNIKILHQIETVDGIRLINDLDIGSLKLLAAADRGELKDFYDLHLLSEKYGLEKIYDVLIERNASYNPLTDENIFNKPTYKPKEDLTDDLTPLGNFNNAGDRRKSGNRIVFTENSEIGISFFALQLRWIEKLKALADERGLKFKETKKPFRGR
ncbi:nucleotidyl transferase AbiEii/AbiGii toxin family protein [Parapedobacter sp. 10938]|uniref:nucleotidyl transferase AbiEii/AbiGii toxin family protein n=1 Tax=Parapedobacter flavus TaxID=3110225 RepID=UPI002DBD281E|nr:nucleotidyl transferase AbiEii/AbiGii toxin family protein [Parapedobacter sp. 10938]MEC3881801.1 nucleotidyl transferase AbiEii/AbiGii toxin family protein [Parapedobacter sp. 10938]